MTRETVATKVAAIGVTSVVGAISGSRGRVGRMAACVVVLACWLGLASAPASAMVTRPLLSSFNASDAPGGPFIGVGADAVDQASGDVYVLDWEAGVVDKFNASGSYAGVQMTGGPEGSFSFAIGTSGVAVDNSAGGHPGVVYVADTNRGVVDRFSSAGGYLCQITGAATPSATECNGASGSKTPAGSMSPTGIAVNAGGDVFVADGANNVIDEFGPTGEYIAQISDLNISGPGTIAFDSTGNLYVNNFFSNVVKFDSAGSFVSVLESSGDTSVGVDPATDHVFAGSGSGVTEYEASGATVDSFGSSLGGVPVGLAVNGSSGEIYAADQFGNNGTAVDIFGPVIVIPDVTTGQATNVGQTTATLNGQVDPDTAHGGGPVTSCEFEYGTTTSYGQTGPCSPATPYSGSTSVSADISGLTPDTAYHFRLDANNSNGYVNSGQDQTFTTFGPPVVDSESSSRVETTSATVSAQINPFGYDTSCQVQYVDDAAFQSSGYASATTVPCSPADLGSGLGDQGASVALGGLQIGTTYHYRFIAANQAGTATGADQTFATFGFSSFSFTVTDQSGQPYTQAGGHPYELTTSFALNTSSSGTDANLKDIDTKLPPGLIGNPDAVAKCTSHQLSTFDCSGASQVGVLQLQDSFGEDFVVGIYNIVPPAGVPAEFGAVVNSGFQVFIYAHLRTGGDYGITTSVINAVAATGVTSATVTFWGVPADPSHDAERECHTRTPCSANAPLTPFLTDPTSCAGPLTATMRADSWQDPGAFATASSTLPAITGCDRLGFTPSITVQPDTTVADSPSGLHVDLSVPQDGLSNPAGLAQANLKDATVTLPQGMSVNPSAADGLQSCTPAQIGIDNANPPSCPDASKIGTVEIDSPLLPDPLRGGVYLAQQARNPFGSLLAIYLTAEADGTLIKLAGHVVADPVTGQLTTTFSNNPQLPFTDLKLDLFGGPHAALATPESCGAYATTSDLSPWSGGADVLSSDPFTIDTGCVSGFSPSFMAGTQNAQAGSYSPFALSFSRSDADQELAGLSVKLPPGLLANLSGVPLCSNAAANAGTCPAGSQVGSVEVGAGAGPAPFFLPGKVYLTTGYRGGQYGLAVVVPAVAGPYDLGTVVVRQALYVDPTTAQVTDVSDPFPTILDGIPLRTRRVDVTIDRPRFTIDPTSCDPTAIAGTLTSTGGLSAPVSSRFQTGGCASLAFKPSFVVSTSAHTTKRFGASLDVKLSYPKGSLGRQADVRSVRVELPSELPSRQSTLQKACAEATFDANPAACPAESRVGMARASTPLLPAPMTGPAYFVSHGGARFPELVIVLQGYGLTIELHGETFISKAGITSSTFRTVPDVPVEAFELTLPQGRYSVLAANGNLCASRLRMPTTLTAQNGAVIHQDTRIAVTGCRPAIRVLRRHASGRRVTLTVSVPAAGRLTASGDRLTRASRTLRKAGETTLTLMLTRRGRQLLAGHPNRRLRVRVKLVFAPRHGHRLVSTVAVLVG